MSAANSFHQFIISEDDEKELFTLCRDLKNKVENSPWAPFFDQNKPLETRKNLFNVYEIAETTVEKEEIKINGENVRTFSLRDVEEMCVDERIPQRATVLDKVLEGELQELKQMLLDIKNDRPPQEYCPEVSVFNSISPSQVPIVCEVLHLSAMNDIAIATILNSLSVLEPTISLILAASVVHHAVHSRMENWTFDTSRALTNSILMFTKKYPKAVVDELLVPCLKDESLGISQTDLIHGITDNGLPDDQVPYCLREYLKITSPNENACTAVHCLIDRKVPLDTFSYHTLTERIYIWSETFNSNVKFSKLLKSIISIYGNQMTEDQLFTLNIVVKNNTTFAKNSLENMLKKLSIKHVD